MSKFSKDSNKKLDTCDKELRELFTVIVENFNCTILEGRRSKERQNKLYEEGRSKLKWPNSNHNVKKEGDLSKAVDVAPYPIDWKNKERFYYFAGFVLGVADVMGIDVRWGGDWDMDNQIKDNNFDDLVHFELVND